MTARAWSGLLAATLIFVVAPSFADFKKGEKVQTIANLHPDMQRHVLFTLNYQQDGLIPVCSDVTIIKSGKKKLTFEFQGQEFEIAYEGFTEKAGVPFQKAVRDAVPGQDLRQGQVAVAEQDRQGRYPYRPAKGGHDA